MNLQEFAKLKVGDKIDNAAMYTSGTICEVTPEGVRVRWGKEGGLPFLYTAQTTAWFHWSKVTPQLGENEAAELTARGGKIDHAT